MEEGRWKMEDGLCHPCALHPLHIFRPLHNPIEAITDGIKEWVERPYEVDEVCEKGIGMDVQLINDRLFVETARFQVCPREGTFGIQVPQAAWHSVVVHEPSTILEAKDGAYIPPK